MAKLVLTFRRDDLSGEAVRALVARHLAGMHENSPACYVSAFDIDRLLRPGVTFWSVWDGGTIAGMGALKQLDGKAGELKSMRVADAYLGNGVGRAMLRHLIDQARAQGMNSLWLETGSGPAFVPAHRLYESEGFEYCGAFGDYQENLFSRFMRRGV